MLYVIDQPLTCLRVHGKKSAAFLQGLVTTDVQHVNKHQSAPTFFCQYQGKAISYGYVSCFANNDYYLHVATDLAPQILAHFAPYAALDRIDLAIASDHISVGLVSDKPLMHLEHADQAACINDHISLFCIAHAPFIYLVYGSNDHIDAWLLQQNAHPVIHDIWQAACIQAGQPLITTHTSATFTPNVLQPLPSNAVSLKKGCYLGQEIIARSHHLGQLKKTLSAFYYHDFQGEPPKSGSLLYAAQQQTTTHATVLAAAMYESTLWLQAVVPLSDHYQPTVESEHGPCLLLTASEKD